VTTTDLDAVLTIDLPNAKVGLGDLGLTPDATMRMSSEDANLFWQGKVNLPVAMARKKIVVDGKMGPLLRLLPQTKHLFASYVELLEADGRTDLIAS
jgi:putative sterol carrier protein